METGDVVYSSQATVRGVLGPCWPRLGQAPEGCGRRHQARFQGVLEVGHSYELACDVLGRRPSWGCGMEVEWTRML